MHILSFPTAALDYRLCSPHLYANIPRPNSSLLQTFLSFKPEYLIPKNPQINRIDSTAAQCCIFPTQYEPPQPHLWAQMKSANHLHAYERLHQMPAGKVLPGRQSIHLAHIGGAKPEVARHHDLIIKAQGVCEPPTPDSVGVGNRHTS